MIDEASALASDSWILDSAATSSDHGPVLMRLKGKVQRVWTPGAKGAGRGKRLIAFQISKVEEFNDLVRESFPSQDVLSREPVTASPGFNVQSESKRSKRSRKSRIIDVDVTPCIALHTIQEDVPTYQSEPVESVFCSEAQRNLECSVGTFVVETSLQTSEPGYPKVGISGVRLRAPRCCTKASPVLLDNFSGNAVTADEDSFGVGSAVPLGSPNIGKFLQCYSAPFLVVQLLPTMTVLDLVALFLLALQILGSAPSQIQVQIRCRPLSV